MFETATCTATSRKIQFVLRDSVIDNNLSPNTILLSSREQICCAELFIGIKRLAVDFGEAEQPVPRFGDPGGREGERHNCSRQTQAR